jgi:UDP-N-acetylmuramate--alanine ligase
MNGGIEKAKKIHFVGIGGIGISALARMMLEQGKIVTGSDMSDSNVVQELKTLGAKIHKGHGEEHVEKDHDLLVYTIAVQDDNPELKKAKDLGIPTMTYPEMLGEVSRSKYVLAISGTHGKTTTTAMLGKILLDAGLDPTIVIGTILRDEKSNFVMGQSRYFLTEACEYKRSFLNLHPDIVVITNIEEDHLDYYKDLGDIQDAFIEFTRKLGSGGHLVCDPKDPNLAEVIEKAKCQIWDYTETNMDAISLEVFGDHNRRNAQAALTVSSIIGVDRAKAGVSLSGFRGTWRRFEYKGTTRSGAKIYDDYAHHPTEIKATLAATRESVGQEKKILAVFQPHLYSRTKQFFNDFSESFGEADEVLILPIYAAREKDDKETSSEALVQAIQKKHSKAGFFSTMTEVAEYIKRNAPGDSTVVIMGAGDVFKVADEVISKTP